MGHNHGHGHHEDGCHYGHHGHHDGVLRGCEADIIRHIPLLRFLREPVMEVDDLYRRHPLGGQPGWVAFVFKEKTFAYWHHGKNRWELIRSVLTKDEFFRCFGVDMRTLKDSQTLLWDSDAGTFRLFVIRTVADVPSATDDEGLYLVEDNGVYVVDGGVVKEILSKSKWENLAVGDFQADWDEMDVDALPFIKNKPTIPEVYDAAILFRQGGADKGTITLNQQIPAVIDLDSGADDFTGFTITHLAVNDSIAGNNFNMSCTVPPAAYDDTTGEFYTSALIRLRLPINPFTLPAPPNNPTGKNVRIMTHLGGVPWSWDLKHYGSGNNVVADELFFVREIYARYDATTNTLFTD